MPPIPTFSWTSLLVKAEKIGYAGIAAFLIYIGAMVIRQDVADIKANVSQHVTASDEVEKKLNSILNVNVQFCVNAAQTQAKRDACFTALTFAPVRDPR